MHAGSNSVGVGWGADKRQQYTAKSMVLHSEPVKLRACTSVWVARSTSVVAAGAQCAGGAARSSSAAADAVGCVGLAFGVYSSSLEMSLLVSELLVGRRETLLWDYGHFEFLFTC
jgi:hypothetical protein